ncbi:MAG: tetratricopeptide repeat protein [Nitrospirae bacterium]|nr:tetratricopeptide repeat protein [Nitrospirota bacterium]MBF0535295.1 tetratricopeptide repeat protein [Nitrospirota bacterium]MBF0617282.1 tetratricopeptide repeat protein [Nitrospirota bacterium]
MIVTDSSDFTSSLTQGIEAKKDRRFDDALMYFNKAKELNKFDPLPHIAIGLTYRDNKDFDNAITAFKSALTLSPYRADIYKALGLIYKEKDEFNEALISLENAAKYEINDGGRAEIFSLQGDIYLKLKSFKAALEAFNKSLSLESSPSNKEHIYYQLALSYFNLKKYHEAIEHAIKSLEIKETEKAHSLLARIYELDKKHGKAKECLKKAIKINPHNAKLHLGLGNILLSEGTDDGLRGGFHHLKEAVEINPDNLNILLAASFSALKVEGHNDFIYDNAKKILQLNHDNFPIIFALCVLFAQIEKYDEIDLILEKLISSNPDDTNVITLFITIKIMRNQLAEATAALSKLDENTIEDPFTLFNMASSYNVCKNAEKAERCLDKAVKHADNDLELISLAGRLYKELKKYDKAIDMFSKCLESAAGDLVEIYFELGDIYYKLDNLVKAKEFLLKSLHNNSKHLLANWGIILVYYKENDFTNALRHLETFDKYVPKNPHNYRGLSMNYRILGKYTRALKNIQKAIDLEPDNYENYLEKSKSFIVIGNFDEAKTACEKALEINPESYKVFKLLGDIYLKLKDYNKSVNFYKSALEKTTADIDDEELANLHNRLAITYRYNGDYNNAFKEIEIANKLLPNNALYTNNLGFVYFLLVRIDEAIEQFNKSIALDEKDNMPVLNLAMCLLIKDKKEEGINKYKEAIKLTVEQIKSRKNKKDENLNLHMEDLNEAISKHPDWQEKLQTVLDLLTEAIKNIKSR